MFGHQYYHGILRKYVIAFGSLFNDIVVQRFDKNGNRIQSIAVPIAYGPKEKFLVRLRQDPNLDRDIAIQLPRIGFEMQQVIYNPQRKLQSTIRNVQKSRTADGNVMRSQFAPVPYDINMLMSIFVKNADDGTQIIEQILPFFTPEWTIQMRHVPEMSQVHDVPVVLNSVTIEDTYEGDFDSRRSLVWNLDFMMKGYLFGPVSQVGVIKRTLIDFYVPPVANTAVTGPAANNELKISTSDISAMTLASRIRLQPGLLANGSPTTNSAASVSIDTIQANDAFGFAYDNWQFGANTA